MTETQAEAGERMAREARRAAAAERARAEGWDAGEVPAGCRPWHDPDDPFCECKQCLKGERQ